MSTLTLTASEFRTLVTPVLPLAGRDDMLPVLTAVAIETQDKWLSATATDRFRAGIKRIPKRPTEDDPSTDWPEFKALLPTRAIRSLLTAFKPRRGTLDPTLTFTVEDGKLTAEAIGLFDLFDAARFVHRLEDGEFPAIRKIIKEALDMPDADRRGSVGLNPAFLADFKACGASTLRVAMPAPDAGPRPRNPIVVTDDDGFIGILMPRSLFADSATSAHEDWSDFLAPAEAEPKKRVTRKPAKAAS